jgi:hypothetical protein
MTTRIRKVITAIDANGNAFSEQHTETQVGDKWFPNDPTPLDSLSSWGTQFAASVQTENATLKADLAAKTTAYDAEVAKSEALEADKATLTDQLQLANKTLESVEATALDLGTQLAEANATIAGLQTRIVELTPPPSPLSITRYQCTTWLRGANILQPSQSVSDLIKLIVADPDQQLRALDRWELGTSVLRNDPMIETLGQLLGLTAEQLDAAFLIASQIQ